MHFGITTLKKLDNTAYDLLKDKAKRLRNLLDPILKTYAERVLFLQMESIFAFYFTKKKIITSVSEVKESDMKAFANFHSEMLKRGIYLSPSGYEVGFLSTAHSDEDIKKTAQAISESLDAVFEE